MSGDPADPAGVNELAQFRVLTTLSMQGRMAGTPVGDAHLLLLMQEQPGSVVAMHQLCCQSRTNHRYAWAFFGWFWYSKLWMDNTVART